jgi:hypothetical protein
MKPLLYGIAVAAAILSATGAADARYATDPRTAAAVLAADDAWGQAEERGDVAFVDALLLADYRSIGHDGKVRNKSDILTSTRKKGGTPQRAAEVAAWRAQHPTRGLVTLFGDTAVLSWVSTSSANPGAVASSDIFVYRNGRWHAVYSQHSDA